jgi:transcriptional regulator with XRE-family HTH domain
VPQEKHGIPSGILAGIIREWIIEYGPTFPLYGKESVRHDISGSVRPLLSSTELPHEKILAERSGVSKRTIVRILSGETKWVSEEVTDRLVQAMERPDSWYLELSEWR